LAIVELTAVSVWSSASGHVGSAAITSKLARAHQCEQDQSVFATLADRPWLQILIALAEKELWNCDRIGSLTGEKRATVSPSQPG